MPEFRTLLWTLLLVLIIASPAQAQQSSSPFLYLQGAIVRGDTSHRALALVFTGDTYADGGMHIAGVLERQGIKGSFFLTGKFYRNPDFKAVLDALVAGGHYMGAHSDQHLLYCDWEKRDSLLVSREEFRMDLENNYKAMQACGVEKKDAPFFLPPYEWYNDSIAAWTASLGLQLINFTHGTLSHADYTVPGTSGYRTTQEIYSSILDYETKQETGLRGFILLSHIGTEAGRSDKFYLRLEELISELKSKGYHFLRVDELLEESSN